jgi:hydroxymethylglutaryl-CoA lyase
MEVKVNLIKKLRQAGIRSMEVGSFVRADWVPQMADTAQVVEQLKALLAPADPGLMGDVAVLTPNMKGLEAAIASGVGEVAVFGSASEKFSKKNINCSIDESILKFQDVAREAISRGLRVRGYVSCVLGCPYEGAVDPERVLHVSKALLDVGCYEVSLGDTIGTGNPVSTDRLLRALTADIPVNKLAVHFHDTYGTALANIVVALSHGVSSVDSSVSGLGGCPYAKGASGNVATEDVVHMLHGMGIQTGIDMDVLLEAGALIDEALGNRPRGSKAAIAIAAGKAAGKC